MQYPYDQGSHWLVSLGVLVSTIGGAIVYQSLGSYGLLLSTQLLGLFGWGILLTGMALTIRYVG